MNFRKLHRKLAPILFLPLLLTSLTGIAYRLSRNWFGFSGDRANFLMTIHQGEFLGTPLVPVYVLLLGLGLLGSVVTGLTMIRRKTRTIEAPAKQDLKKDFRFVHRIIAPIVFLPLIVSAVTGIIYSLGKAWFALSDRDAAIFLRIHQGSYLGSFFKSIYVLLIGAGLLILLITGIEMTGIFRRLGRSRK